MKGRMHCDRTHTPLRRAKPAFTASRSTYNNIRLLKESIQTLSIDLATSHLSYDPDEWQRSCSYKSHGGNNKMADEQNKEGNSIKAPG